MYNAIPLFIILVSLFIIVVIIVRKFSVLASLDIDSIQAEKEAQFKEQILSNRLKRNIIRYSSKMGNVMKPIGGAMLDLSKKSVDKLKDFKENYNKEEKQINSEEDLKDMSKEAEELIKEERLDEAEKKFIDIISSDSQNLEAFKGLGKLYVEKKQYSEAKQSFEHIIKLLENDELNPSSDPENQEKTDVKYLASVYYELSLVYKESEESRKALDNIKRATDLEPNNPRYLDMKLEISIINEDKGTALDALDKLKEVNPENQKLAEFEEKIREL